MEVERQRALLEQCREALARDPHDPQLEIALAQVLEELGERAQAGHHYLAAARGFAAWRRTREAAESCARVLTLDVGNADAVALLRRLGDEEPEQDLRRVTEGLPVVLAAPAGEPAAGPQDPTTESVAPEGEWFEDEMTERRPAARPSGAPPPQRGEEGASDASSSKRPRLRTRRPERKVSPLDRTVIDGGEAPSRPAVPAPLPPPPEPRPRVVTRGRVEGALPPRRPRRTISAADRTEVESVSDRVAPGVETPAPPPVAALMYRPAALRTETDRQAPPRGGTMPTPATGGEDRTEIEVELPTASPEQPERSASRPASGEASTSTVRLELPPTYRQLARVSSFGRGELVLREGDPGADLLVVEAGELQVSRQTAAGAVLLATLGEGSFFGEFGLLGDGLRHATVRATRPTRVLALTRAQARQLMQDDRAAHRLLRRAYRDRLRELVLATAPLLKALPPHLADRLLGEGKPVGCPANEPVMKAGDYAPGFFIVLLGALDVLLDDRRLGEVREGDCFGHGELLGGLPSRYVLRPPRFAQLLQLAPAHFADLCRAEPAFARLVERDAVEWMARVSAGQR